MTREPEKCRDEQTAVDPSAEPDSGAEPRDRDLADQPRAPGPASSPGKALLESLILFSIATLACAVLWQLARAVAFFKRHLQAMIAAVFLYLPTGLLLRRREDFDAYGLTHRPLGRGLLLFLWTSLAVFPLFAVGFVLYYRVVCAAAGRGVALPRQLVLLCRRFVGGPGRARLRMAPDFWEGALAQVLVVALPEEYFFRGYLQTRLESVWPSRRRLLGARVGPALLVASVLFALGHLLVDFNGLRLAVFFPALVFGWMRQYSGSILAPVLFHASSNLVSEVLHRSFF